MEGSGMYLGLQCITEDSPELLIEALQKIKTPFSVVQFVHTGSKASAYILGDTKATLSRNKKGK